jgi:hypothetical protein
MIDDGVNAAPALAASTTIETFYQFEKVRAVGNTARRVAGSYGRLVSSLVG